MDELLGLANALNDLFYTESYNSIPVDVVEGENQYVVYAEMPGVAKEDIKLNFENGVLSIEATKKKKNTGKYLIQERNTMKLKRSLEFGDIHEESLNAKYENGILMITITTVAPKPKKTIEIQ